MFEKQKISSIIDVALKNICMKKDEDIFYKDFRVSDECI